MNLGHLFKYNFTRCVPHHPVENPFFCSSFWLGRFCSATSWFHGNFSWMCLFVCFNRVWTKPLWIISCLFRTLGKVMTWPTSSGLPRLTQKHKSYSRPLVLVYISLVLCKLTAMPNGNTLFCLPFEGISCESSKEEQLFPREKNVI